MYALYMYVTLDHKTGLKCQFFEIEIYTSSNPYIEKIAFKVVQMKFLAMHITNQKWSFDVFTVINLQNIFMEHDLYLIS